MDQTIASALKTYDEKMKSRWVNESIKSWIGCSNSCL
jgi:hypothetical protein